MGPRREAVSGGVAALARLASAAALLLAALLLAAPSAAQDAPPPVALLGATLIDGTGAAPVRDAAVVVREGRITCAGPRARCPVPADVRVEDVTGRWIVPGLVDGHVHYSQTGWADGRPDQAADPRERFPYAVAVAENRARPERYWRAYLCSGVTATWDVGGYPWTWDLREEAELRTDAPHVSAAGPLISAADHWLNVPAERQFLYMASDAAVDTAALYLAASRTDAVKVWYLVGEDSPNRADLQRMLRVAARRAEEAGLPLIVHATNLWAAKDALDAGARHLVHSVQDAPVDEEFLALALDNGASYNPTLTVYRGIGQFRERRFDPDGLPMQCVDPETREKARLTDDVAGRADPAVLERARERTAATARIMADNLRRVHEAGIPVVMGTDAGNTLTLHGASVFREMEAMAAAGMSPMDVLVASTRNPAVAMGRGGDLGTVEAGRVADLLVLSADPSRDVAALRRIESVMRGGRLHRRDELAYPRP
ncbi:MAG: amidohydrolase family protein [Gemmatimonadetes bacterium]|nr:amidohydrolase family protein [Gemmatimonadota bacterium]